MSERCGGGCCNQLTHITPRRHLYGLSCIGRKATGARIKELRKARHLTVEDVAGFMGFESEQAVYKWQRGDSLPTVDNLYALSRLFGTTVDDILVGSIERDESPSFSVLGGIPMPIESASV